MLKHHKQAQRQIRTQKRQYKADGEPEYYVNYVWQDGLLTHQSMTYYFHMTLNGTEKVVELPFTAKFVYDESNTPVGCLVNDEAAVGFVRNLQGDIIAVVNQEGTALLEYSYDPWGKVTITQNGENLTEQEAAIIAVLCPFAYRGYNYDFTTGLYYLQSRYYNPEWGRFLNVDDTNILLSTQGENLGANLFAYCNNNPVNMVDFTGYWSEDVHSGFWDELGKNRVAYGGVYIPINPNNNKKYGTYYWATTVGFKSQHAKIIAEYDASVDDNYGFITQQNWHFNTSPKGQVDSRIIVMTLMMIVAFANFDEALHLKNEGNSFYTFFLYEGLKALGKALHPAQDYFAHTDDRVYDIKVQLTQPYVTYSSKFPFVVYHPPTFALIKSHFVAGDITDNVVKRWGQLEKTANATISILSDIYSYYKPLFK